MAAPRRHSSQRLTLVILLLASITLVTLDYRGPASHAFTSVRNSVRDAFAPLQSGLSDIFDPIGDFFSGAFNYGAAVNTNAHLRAEVGTLRREALENAGAEQELEQLLAQLHLPYVGNSKPITADVIKGTSSNVELTIELDKGTAEGVGDGMPVVAGAGLVGTVIEAGRSTSVIRLVTDPRSAVAVRFADGAVAVADGQGLGKPLVLEDLPASAPAPKKGEAVTTSGLEGAAYPAGLPVGTVSSVRSADGSLTRQVLVNPVADLTGLEFVDVMEWLPAA